MKRKNIRILIFGTFDTLHPGHVNFFRQARRLAKNPYLIVSLARGINVKRIKGKQPLHSERRRLAAVKRHPLVNKALLGAPRDYLGHIVKLQPDIIALGYDQVAYTQDLKKKLLGKGLTVRVRRLKAYRPDHYKTSLIINKNNHKRRL